jgi:pre-60S factor REI1
MQCYTAPGVTFGDRDELQAHYRSDWHRYNLKRKVANLLPVKKEDFERRRDEALAMANATKISKTAHLKGGKADKKLKAKKAYKPTKKLATSATEQKEGEASIFQPGAADAAMDDAPSVADMGVETPASYPVNEEAQEIDLRDSIFDSHRSEDMEANLVYMHKNFGFFLPDAEYLVDTEGMLEWCSKKAKHGRLCLHCGRMFKTCHGCQQHMIDSCHCKLKYEEEDDLEEYEDFYDFTSGWDDYEDDEEELDTEGIAEALGHNEAGGWETCSDDDEDMEGEEEKGEESGGKKEKKGKKATFEGKTGIGQAEAFVKTTIDSSTYAKKKKIKPKIKVLDSGELLITRGNFERRVGIKDLNRYYKQKYRPEDERDSVRLASNERVKLLYKQAGIETNAFACAKFNNKADTQSQLLYIMRKLERKLMVSHVRALTPLPSLVVCCSSRTSNAFSYIHILISILSSVRSSPARQ